jgi:hypothetical protein
MAMSLLENGPNAYDASKYTVLSRKQFSIQLKSFNPEYLGSLGDKISKYTVYKYLMNSDKKWKSMIEDSREELIITTIAPSIIAATSLLYLITRKNKVEEKKAPVFAKM